jgi:hypothetical protein
MEKITNKLKKIDITTIQNIENSVLSIYKIDKNHHFFISLLKDYPSLKDAEYIVYPNINSSTAKLFLDIDGQEILKYEQGISEFILLPCGFDIKTNTISIDNPYLKNFTLKA